MGTFHDDGMGNRYKIHAEGPDDRDDLSRWSEDLLVKHIINQRLDATAAQTLAERWVSVSTGLRPDSAAFRRHVAAILLAVDQLRQQEAKMAYRAPGRIPVDPDSERLDRLAQDYMRRNYVTYDEAILAVGKREPNLAKSYTQVNKEEGR
jgi:hypothetical protein